MLTRPRTSISLLFAVVVLALAGTAVAASEQQPPEQTREIVRVAGELYRVQAGKDATVFLATPEGIVLADPLNTMAARWLKNELASRFADRPVRYVVQTSHTFERVSGGGVFRPEAEVVGHQGLNSTLQKATTRLPPSLAGLDRSGNNRLERAEVEGVPLPEYVTASDRNSDGVLSAGELYAWVTYPKQTFSAETTLTLGDKSVRLLNPGGRYDPAATVILFPEERVLYSGASTLTAGSFAFGDRNANDAIAWMRALAALPFETIVTGTGETLTRGDFDALLKYLEHLKAEVAAGYKAGLSAAQIQARPTPDEFRRGPNGGGRNAHIAAIYDTVRLTWTELQGAASVQWLSRNTAYCDAFDTCESGGRAVGGTVGFRIAARRFGGLVEIAFGEQLISSRESRLYDDAFAHRRSRGSLLLWYGRSRPNTRSVTLLAGPSIILGDSVGVARVKEGFPPFAGRRPLAERSRALGLTVGSDVSVPVSNSLSIVAPVRVTMTPAPQDTWPGTFDVQAGVGLRLGMSRRVQ